MKRFKKLLSMMLAVVLVVGAVNLPAKEVKAAESVTLGFESGHVRDANKDFLIYLTGLTTDQVNALGTGGVNVSTINIDGKKCGGYGYNLSGKLAILVNWKYFDGLETAVTDVGRHFVTIPKGATIGPNKEYTVAEDLTLVIDGAATTKVKAVQNFVSLTVKSAAARDTYKDYLAYLNGFTAAQLDGIGANGMGVNIDGNVLIDGSKVNGSYVWNMGSGNLGLITPYSSIQSGATTAAEITEEHEITLLKGTQIGSYTVDRDVTLKVKGTSAEWVNQSDATPTLSIAANRTDVLMLKAEEIETPPADVAFEAVDSASVYQYNGVASQYSMIYSKHGGIYADVAGMTGSSKTAPDTGDMITIKGRWRYLGDRKIYDFGTTNYSWNGTEWIEGVFVETETPTLTIAANRTDLLMLAIAGVTTPTDDTKFEAVDENSVYLYNGEPTSYAMTYAKWGGIYADVKGMSGKYDPTTDKGKADVGDTITIGGIWKYLGNGKYYDFGTTSYKWNGSTWAKAINIETDTVKPTLTIAENRSDLLMLAITGVTTPTDDTKFEAYDENSIYLYNGEESLYDLTYSKWGGIYADAGYMRGDMSHTTSYVHASTGDTITIGGVWKYGGVYYNFETTTYEYNGSQWEVQPTPLTLTEHQVVDRPGSNDWMFYMTPSFEIDDSLFGTAGYMYLGVCQPIVTVGTTATTATNSEIYIFPGNDDVGVTVKRTFLSGTPTAGTTVTFPAGMRITYNNVVYRTTEDFVWRYDGSTWVKYVKPDYYTPTLFAGSNTEVNGVYLTNADDMPYDVDWQLNYTAKDSTSGVWVNGSRTEVFLKKILADRWYVCLQDKDITATRGTTVAVKGTFVNGENEIEFTETTYIYDGTKWCTGSELDMDFAITGMGNSTYESGSGWKLRFNTDSIVYGEDFATQLGTYTIQVNGKDTVVSCASAEGNNLGIFVEGLSSAPQGTIVKVPSGTIGEYTLTNTYEIIYDAGEWKLAHATHDVTLSFSHKMDGTNNLVYHHTEDLTGLLTKGQTFKASYADSGIYVNGTKMNDAGIFWWTETNDAGAITSSYFVIDHGSIATNRGDIVTIKGTFNLGDTYLSFPEVSARFVNATNWVSSCNYESVYQLFVTDITSGTWQETYNRWLFRAATSMPIEHNSAEFTTAFNPLELIVTIIDPEGNSTTLYELPAYNADNPTKTAADHLGFFITTAQGLPQDPTGWSITIEPSVLQTTENTYKIMSAYTYTFQNGMWGVVSEREKPASGVFADANGDGTFNAADYVAALKEKQGVFTQEGKKYLCAPDALIAGKTKLQDSDVIRIREELLDRGSSSETYVPVYLVDEEMELAGYQGPREISQDKRFDANGNLRTDYTKTSFLTDQYFQWYKDAGFNTLVAEGDAPFNSENANGLKSAPGYWTNLENYMNMAAKYDLDVYVTSSLTNAYLKDLTVSTATNSGSETTFDPDYANMEADLREMLTGEGSSHPGTGLLSFENFKGVMLADELYERWLPNYLNANQVLAAIDPDIEVTSAALSSNAVGMYDDIGDLITSDYETYATKYASYSMNKNFVYDFYPYQGAATESGALWWKEYDYDPANAKTDDTWLDKLEASAVRAQENGWTTGVALQSFAMDNHASKKVFRSPENKDDIGFQVYTALAYGMKNFNYFTFWEHKDQSPTGEVHTDAMVVFDENDNPKRTGIYYAVQAVNNEITQFDHVFLDYDWKSTIYVGSSSLFSSLTQGSSSRITNKTSTNPAIIGCMYDDQKGLDGFWIVNATTPEDDKSNTVTVKFNDATRAMIYNPATGTYGDIINLTDSTYTANLASGEGQFIIPLP